jgi:hypothetical protein
MPRTPLKVKTRVVDKDRGWKRVLKEASVKRHVVVGIRGDDDSRVGDSLGNVELGAIHEFGLGNNPERSFIRDPIDENLSKYRPLTKALGRKVYTLKISLTQALNVLGLKAQADMRNAINRGIEPGLKPATKAQKAKRGKPKNKPLIFTGQLKSAITYKVTR